MQVETKLIFDTDDDDDKEKLSKINDVLVEKEECCDDEDNEPDYESFISDLDSFVQEELDEAKTGSTVAKKLEQLQEKIVDLKSEYNIEE
jgi:hypothetical protein